MEALNKSEETVLRHIAEDCAAEFPGLPGIIDRIRVVKRENTGGGFYTDLRVIGDQPEFDGPSPIGDRLYKIDGYDTPFGAILFLSNGVPSLIDFHSFGADTHEIDFARITLLPWQREGGSK